MIGYAVPGPERMLAADSTSTVGDSGAAVAVSVGVTVGAGVYVGTGRVGIADAVALGIAVS
jgi:hypothetical protein